MRKKQTIAVHLRAERPYESFESSIFII